jgi:hypothetical protein
MENRVFLSQYPMHAIVKEGKKYLLPPSMSRLSRQCGILNISQPYRPPWPVTGIALTIIGIKISYALH